MGDDHAQQEASTATMANPDRVTAGDPFILSDLDMISPDTLVTSYLVYESRLNQNFQLISESLNHGLTQAAEQLPPLAAKIHFDSSKRPMKNMTPSSLKLQVRKFELEEHKSYHQLTESSFSPYDFDRLRLLPEDAYADKDEKPLFIAQLNLIPGGLILALGFNHIATDGGGRSLATTLICKCSKTYLETTSTSSVPRLSFDYQRGPLNAPRDLLALPRDQLISRIKDHQIINTAPSTNGTHPAPKPNGIANMPKGLIYRIEGPTVQKLKESCKPLNGATYLSTYDCIVALLWRSILRIRAELKPHLMNTSSRLLHPVDLRNRTGIPKSYFGNAVTVASAGPLAMPDLLGHHGLSLAASSIRTSIANASVASLAEAIALGTMVEPNEKVVFRPSGGLLEQNLMLTTWYFNDTRAYDFGAGPPAAVRTWAAPVPGFLILFPDCGREERGGGERVYDFFVSLMEEEQELLRKDEEVRMWFRVL